LLVDYALATAAGGLRATSRWVCRLAGGCFLAMVVPALLYGGLSFTNSGVAALPSCQAPPGQGTQRVAPRAGQHRLDAKVEQIKQTLKREGAPEHARPAWAQVRAAADRVVGIGCRCFAVRRYQRDLHYSPCCGRRPVRSSTSLLITVITGASWWRRREAFRRDDRLQVDAAFGPAESG